MILDKYSLQTKAIFVGAIIIAIVLIVFLVRHQSSRSRDVELVAEAKILANALEQYYAIYRVYPEVEKKITLDKVRFISDQGINQNGSTIFYTNKFIWSAEADVSLAIQSDDYQLDFTVFNSWPAWGVSKAKGGRCRVQKEVAFYCADWAK